MNLDRAVAAFGTIIGTIPVGTEPYGLALTPTAQKLYVANARSRRPDSSGHGPAPPSARAGP